MGRKKKKEKHSANTENEGKREMAAIWTDNDALTKCNTFFPLTRGGERNRDVQLELLLLWGGAKIFNFIPQTRELFSLSFFLSAKKEER